MISGLTCRFLGVLQPRSKGLAGRRGLSQTLRPHPSQSSTLRCTLCCRSGDINGIFPVNRVRRMVPRLGMGRWSPFLCLNPDTATLGSAGSRGYPFTPASPLSAGHGEQRAPSEENVVLNVISIKKKKEAVGRQGPDPCCADVLGLGEKEASLAPSHRWCHSGVLVSGTELEKQGRKNLCLFFLTYFGGGISLVVWRN